MQIVTPREQKSQETKAKIFEAVHFILEKYGIKTLTVRNICDQADISTGSFYNFFQNKENLIFEYTKSCFSEMLQRNPLPEWINADDFVKRTCWPFVVYALFCEKLGKNYVKYLYQNCDGDAFIDVCFDSYIVPSIKRAYEEGYLSRSGHPEMTQRVVEDLKIIIRGAVWCWSSESSKDDRQLVVVIEQVVSRILLATASDAYHALIPIDGYSLLSDDCEKIYNTVVY